uniref:Uncharacterized protein n=1 Tax=Aegilops tauschii TaxID=37682 RepID=R7WD90_AEGTA
MPKIQKGQKPGEGGATRRTALLLEEGRRLGAAVRRKSRARPGVRPRRTVFRLRVHLCAVDLATATAESPPEVRGVWEEFRLPGDWLGGTSSLVHLGSGKMCIFRFFGTVPSPPIDRSGKKPDRFVVITPVEVGPGDDNDKEIKMVKHRSKRIKLDRFNGHITWVL